MVEAEAKEIHDANDTKQMVATKLGEKLDAIEHIGFIPWNARHGYVKLCDCQDSILFAVQVHMSYLMTIRDGDGVDSFIVQGKCSACNKIYVAETMPT